MKFDNLKLEDIKLIKDTMAENAINITITCQECKNIMPIDTFYKNMEVANRLAYLINVLNGVIDYEEMKFFEFDDFGYYALIGALTEEKAIEFYKEEVADIEENDEQPLEITKEKAVEKLLGICKDEQQKHEAVEEFTRSIYEDETYLILIDGSLFWKLKIEMR